MAILWDGAQGSQAIFFGIVVHRTNLKARRDGRRAVRYERRYRKTRFQNHRCKAGWLSPSLEARVDQTFHALAKLRQRLRITALSVEHVKFDTQKLQDAEISGVQYQQGTCWAMRYASTSWKNGDAPAYTAMPRMYRYPSSTSWRTSPVGRIASPI